ncbi:uncharacterized protein TNCV_4147001 [Trichonephila clavipes]|nr:uncharacterized protein TNCV_4147001 [Trichonephila clavipes]
MLSVGPDAEAQPVTVPEEKGLPRVLLISAGGIKHILPVSQTTTWSPVQDSQLVTIYRDIQDWGGHSRRIVRTFRTKFECLKIVDKECEPLYSPTEIDKEIEAVEQYFDKNVTWRFRAKKQLGKNNKFKSDSDSCKATEESKLIEPMKVKLPKLIIPKFYGEINQWLSFWNSFKTAIHDNNSLNSIDKFTYLKGLLGSSALATVEGFAITAENYAKAVEILKDRFGRKDAIINSHMQKLLSVTPLKRSDDTKVLRQFFDMCQTQIRSLESLDVSFESFSNVLCPIIFKLLTL